jgi:hypothetical protein
VVVLVVAGLVLDSSTLAPDPGDRPGGGTVFQMRPGEERHFPPGAVFENDRMACHDGRYVLWQGAGRFMVVSSGIEVRTNDDGSVDATCPTTIAQA